MSRTVCQVSAPPPTAFRQNLCSSLTADRQLVEPPTYPTPKMITDHLGFFFFLITCFLKIRPPLPEGDLYFWSKCRFVHS